MQLPFKDVTQMAVKCGHVALVTHSGVCHADDACCSALLTLYFEQLGVQIHQIRTRNEDDLQTIKDMPAVVYDVFNGELDHHQDTPVLDGGRTLSSIGKLWRYGKEEFIETFNLNATTWKYIDQHLFFAVDETDNSSKTDPFSFVLNCVRGCKGAEDPDGEDWQRTLDQTKYLLKCVLESNAILSANMAKFDELPYITISGKRFKLNETGHYIPPVSKTYNAKFAGYIFKSADHYEISCNKIIPNNKLKDSDNPDILFIHPQKWFATAKTLDALKTLV